MAFEDKIFERKTLIKSALIPFGFIKKQEFYLYEKVFFDGAFKALITIGDDDCVKGKVIELDTGDEYIPINVKTQRGSYVTSVRNAYKEILDDIAKNCFKKELFLKAQSNRLCAKIKEIYAEIPDFPFEKLPSYGVFRYPQTQKWYALIMNLKRGKVQKDCDAKVKDETVEILNLKVGEDSTEKLLKIKGIFPCYHMNHKNWVTILLEGSVEDDLILRLIDVSRNFALEGKKVKHSGKNYWIIPANPGFFDVIEYFSKNKEVLWKQSAKLHRDDIVYIYVTSPLSQIRFSCQVIEPDIDYEYQDQNLKMKTAVKLKVLKSFKENSCGIKKLRELGVKAVRSQRTATPQLIDYLENK